MPSKRLHILFEIGLILKTIGAVAEILGGIVVSFLGQKLILGLVTWITQGELTEDPSDSFANSLLNTAHHFSFTDTTFVSLYLLSHGVIKLLTLTALFKKRLWAYPLSMVVFVLFIAYQIYRYTYTHSAWLLVLSVFDTAVVWLIYREYMNVKAFTRNLQPSP